jgi:inorganic triphosphatase YgiF
LDNKIFAKGKMSTESELKFVVPDKSLFEGILSLKGIERYCFIDKGITEITDYYFDTPDRKLYHGKAVLRLRVTKEKSVITFKTQKKKEGNVHKRNEIESETTASVENFISGNIGGENEALRAFRDCFGDVEIKNILKNENDRHIIILSRNDIPYYEMALDSVTFTGPGGKAYIFELEIEALTENHEDIEKIGDWLKARFSLEHAGPSKYIHGMQLVGGI